MSFDRTRAAAGSWVRMGVALTATVGFLGCPIGPSSDDAGASNEPGSDAGVVDAGPPPAIAVTLLVDERPHDPDHDYAPTEGPVRYSDPIRVRVEHLEPESEVFLRFEMNQSTSWGAFDVESDGMVDTGLHAPTVGTWDVVDPDGPFWSLMAPSSPPPGLDLTVTVVVEDAQGEQLATAALGRKYVNDDVFTMNIEDGEMIGTLALPLGDGPFPGVLVFGGSEGGRFYGDFMAPLLAQYGYAAFGVAYFGAPGLETDLEGVPIERLEADLAHLADEVDVDASRLAVMGGSRGGELALLLGSLLPEVKAVVATVPSGVVWGSTTPADTAAWTWQGADVPRIPVSENAMFDVTYDANGYAHYNGRQSFLDSIADATDAEVDAATIDVENTQGPILMLSGSDDQLWPSCELADYAWQRLVSSGHVDDHGDENHCIDGAGHSMFTPGGSTRNSTSTYFSEGYFFDTGGSMQANGQAGREANTRTRAFLEEHLGAN